MRLHVLRAQCTLFIDIITSNEPIPHRPTHKHSQVARVGLIYRHAIAGRHVACYYDELCSCSHASRSHATCARKPRARRTNERQTAATIFQTFHPATLPPTARGISLPQHSQVNSKSCLLLTLSTCSLTHGAGSASSKWPGWHTQCVASRTDDKLLFARARAQEPSYVACAQQSIATSAKVNWDLCTVYDSSWRYKCVRKYC